MQRYRTFVENLPHGVAEVDATGAIRFANRALARTLGTTPGGLNGLGPRALAADAEERAHLENVTRGMAEGDATAGMLTARCRRLDSDRTVVLRTDWSRLPDANGAARFLLVATDITGQTRAERDLDRSVRILSRSSATLNAMAHGAAHDLQEPSRLVVLYAQLLQRHCGPCHDAEGNDYAAHIVREGQRMRRLVQALQTYTASMQGTAPLQPVELADVVDRALERLDTTIRETGARVCVDALPTVQGDPEGLVELFRQALDNAFRYRREDCPPTVTLEATPDDAWWHIRITDNGPGFDPAHSENIFQLFRRLYSDTEHPGSGIGLALARAIAERHGGHLTASSEPGQGTTLHLDLPRDANT